MSTVTITIDTDNAAFTDNYYEMQEILEEVAKKLKDNNREDVDSFKIKDSYGNTVGKVTVE